MPNSQWFNSLITSGPGSAALVISAHTAAGRSAASRQAIAAIEPLTGDNSVVAENIRANRGRSGPATPDTARALAALQT